ncbi:MAG TPA: DUF3592 domain-containing protein [Burkholderiales bacterium]
MITQANFWYFFGGLWLAVGTLFAAIGGSVLWRDTAHEARLAREGVAASGVVLSKSMTGSSQDSGFAVEYRFKAGSAVTEGSAKVDGAHWDRLVEGEPIELRYVPGAPEVHAVAGQAGGDRVLGIVFALLGSLFAVSGAVIVWRAAARRRFVEELLREGARADGEVLEVLPANARVNRVPQWAIRYRYRDYAGNTHEARTPPMPQEEARSWRPGERGEVRYESARPHRSVWRGRQ